MWLTALCLLVQSVGASGGVLCVGCSNLWGGVALAGAPCRPASDCCANGAEHGSSPADERKGGGDPGCGCFDVTLPPGAGTLGQSPVKLVLSPWHLVLPAAPVVAISEPLPAHPMRGARAGPPVVRLMLPSALRTVLLV